MAYTVYTCCCVPPPRGLNVGSNAWEGARHRMKTQLIMARVLSCITQVVLTPIDCYYRIQHNRDVSSITKLLIIASWCISLGITSWIVWTGTHRLAVCLSDLCDEMKAMSRAGPQSKDGVKRSIVELKKTAQKIMWTGRLIGATCALMTVNNIGVVTWTGITIYLNGPKGMMFFSYLLHAFSVGIAVPCSAQIWFMGLRDIVHKHVPFTAPDPDASRITTVGQSSGNASSSLPGDGNGPYPTSTLRTLKMTSPSEDSTA
ncbi:hypothetical protein DFS34DRAFT_405491 [Phlyctochytrium arcticum]|nr:hypothetical protein DFS34DRAFT_405491 [Phlyctochytrium arcticum]